MENEQGEGVGWKTGCGRGERPAECRGGRSGDDAATPARRSLWRPLYFKAHPLRSQPVSKNTKKRLAGAAFPGSAQRGGIGRRYLPHAADRTGRFRGLGSVPREGAAFLEQAGLLTPPTRGIAAVPASALTQYEIGSLLRGGPRTASPFCVRHMPQSPEGFRSVHGPPGVRGLVKCYCSCSDADGSS